jgi:succinyl-CoA synthetase alpha subunit/GNAT superfamily N-acetyltransferase
MNIERIRSYCEPAVLRDGTSLLIRAIRPSDKEHLLAHFRGLSPESVRHRMFGAKKTLDPEELRYLTEVDFAKHVALAAVVHDDATEKFIGIGRYFVGEKASAEVAFAVADDYQGRGIGTILLEHLAAIARASGIEQLEAHVMADNHPMMRVFADSGFVIEQTLDAGVCRVAIPTRETGAFRKASMAREFGAVGQSIKPFFEPKSVALIGASRREGSISQAIMNKLVACGFNGPIYPVNPHATEVLGRPAFPSVEAVGASVDLAIVAVPAPAVPEALADCARAHVRAAVVISSGFAETGAAGRAAQNELRTMVRGAGMRLVGPNCMGVLNTAPAVRLNATFAPTWPPPGNVSMSSQSGALGIAMLDHAKRIDLGIAKFVSVGNKADVSGNDLLCYWADDPATQVIALYLESFGNPRRFARIAPEVGRRKPIVAVKSGRSVAVVAVFMSAGGRSSLSVAGATWKDPHVRVSRERGDGDRRREPIRALAREAARNHADLTARPRTGASRSRRADCVEERLTRLARAERCLDHPSARGHSSGPARHRRSGSGRCGEGGWRARLSSGGKGRRHRSRPQDRRWGRPPRPPLRGCRA